MLEQRGDVASNVECAGEILADVAHADIPFGGRLCRIAQTS
jgi:hypothetical protein